MPNEEGQGEAELKNGLARRRGLGVIRGLRVGLECLNGLDGLVRDDPAPSLQLVDWQRCGCEGQQVVRIESSVCSLSI